MAEVVELVEAVELVVAARLVPLSEGILAVLVPPSGAELDLPSQPIAVLLSDWLSLASFPPSFCSAGPEEPSLVPC